MPKKIYFESAVHHFLVAARRLAEEEKTHSLENYDKWRNFIQSLSFEFQSPEIKIKWAFPTQGEGTFIIDKNSFYRQTSQDLVFQKDLLEQENARFFSEQAFQISRKAGLAARTRHPERGEGSQPGSFAALAPQEEKSTDERLNNEEEFHDQWAGGTDVETIPVRQMNEACTAPEMRAIRTRLGRLKGKKVFDLGCGLGEASVYFALEGADVTSADLSQKMLEATERLARRHGVSVTTHQGAAENLRLPETARFDVIYAGNLFHHVEIEKAVSLLKMHLKPEGVLVSWDPVAYNPIINVYRSVASKVRTPDEHPLTLKDIEIFKRHFKSVELEWFWFTTLIIFMLMFLVQRRNPNKERYWKTVVEDSVHWKWLYEPLEKFDKIILSAFPFLKPLCWNVVIASSSPKIEDSSAKCLICGSSDNELWITDHEALNLTDSFYSLLNCKICGFKFLHPLPQPHELSKLYSKDFYFASKSKISPWVFNIINQILNYGRTSVVSRLNKSGRILDVGCGAGGFLSAMRDSGWSVAGIETSESGAKATALKIKQPIFQGEIADFHDEKKFDVITFWHSLEHIRNPAEALQDASRLLKDGGAIVVSVPNASILARIFKRRWAYLDIPRHLYHFRSSHLHRLFEKAGCNVIQESFFSLTTSPLILILNFLNLFTTRRLYLYYAIKRSYFGPQQISAAEHFYNFTVSIILSALLIIPCLILSFILGLIKGGDLLTVVAVKKPIQP